MRGRDLLDRGTAARVVRYANRLIDEAGKLTAVERRQIADVLQAEGLAVGRWRCEMRPNVCTTNPGGGQGAGVWTGVAPHLPAIKKLMRKCGDFKSADELEFAAA